MPYDVGGYLLDRPFRVRRLGHYGLNSERIDESLPFYRDTLGFRVSDELDLARRATDPHMLDGLGSPRGYFMRYGTDHHSFVLYNKRVREALDTTGRFVPWITVNQISWQVSSLAEVVTGEQWLRERGMRMQRSGRDMPGSNWHTYFYDLDGHTNELFYGMEQVGWSGYSKPKALHQRGTQVTAVLPQISETAEVSEAAEAGVSLCSGSREVPRHEATFDVDGILLARPFKIVRMGPVRLFVEDVEQATRFYEDTLGFHSRGRFELDGETCAVLAVGTEHHSIGLYPITMRERLAVHQGTSSLSIGMQVANYRQLRQARAFLLSQGCTEVDLPLELHPGISHALHVLDPDGQVVELYADMEQVVPPRRASQARVPTHPSEWPETLEDDGVLLGEAFMGPWE
jgi:catechol 2,3-dioxygenase-like lactoylglutathione lyase family enzyme